MTNYWAMQAEILPGQRGKYKLWKLTKYELYDEYMSKLKKEEIGASP